MKQTSINKLSEVYNALRDPENARITNQQAAEMIQQVIRAEAMTPAKAGKFNLYNYVANDQIRPAMKGVFHDRGNKVASDAYIMIVIKENYPAEYEGAVLLKDGSYVEIEEVKWDKERKHCETIKHRTSYMDQEGRNHPIYPKWREVIPNLERGGYSPYKFDREKFFKWVEDLRTAHKTETGKGIKWSPMWFCKVGPCGFKAEWFARFIEAMDALGTDEVYLHEDGRRAALVQSDKGVCILMPVMLADNFGEDNPNHVILG
ncbi:MAG: hypothetical protein J6N54_06425 [Bacteroidales bacterium]|nr:hypothetical protein [Bacteroidales bacterium]